MTRSDIVIKKRMIDDLIEKSNLSREEKDEIQNYLSDTAEILDKNWLFMLSLNENYKKHKNDDEAVGLLVAKIFQEMQKVLSKNFNVSDFFND